MEAEVGVMWSQAQECKKLGVARNGLVEGLWRYWILNFCPMILISEFCPIEL
jgi:hypothetical protein